jgi:hypothetical protein
MANGPAEPPPNRLYGQEVAMALAEQGDVHMMQAADRTPIEIFLRVVLREHNETGQGCAGPNDWAGDCQVRSADVLGTNRIAPPMQFYICDVWRGPGSVAGAHPSKQRRWSG